MNDMVERRKAKEGIMMKTITVLLHVYSIIQSKSSKLIANPLLGPLKRKFKSFGRKNPLE